jgi:23S rRNA pseudouridine1911/1915/1917 synthase
VPPILELTVEPYLHGVRIERFLAKHLRNHTKFRLHRMVVAGCVEVETGVADVEHRVRRGEVVRVRLVEPPDKLLPANERPLEIVFEDVWVLVVNKPAGLIVHQVGDFQDDTLETALQFHLDQSAVARGLVRPGLVHRLDRWTSGVLIVAKEHLAHRRLSIDFQERRPSKAYLALVEGIVEPDRGLIDVPLGVQPEYDSVLMSAAADARDPKSSRTRFAVAERYARHTLVVAWPLTGRLHQIRVHLAHIGHPVVNDEFYAVGGTIKRSRFDEHEDAPPLEEAGFPDDPLTGLSYGRHALHAYRLDVAHPITDAPMRFHAPIPDDLRRAIATVRNVPV